jgi:2-C-methyl-D-erythritol 4-phosphate cytidylyltransferase
MGGRTPKQFKLLGGKPIILHTVSQLKSIQKIHKIIVVIHPDEQARAEALFASEETRVPVVFVGGGEKRQDSVWFGVQMLDHRCDLVLIHDAVRPLVSPRLIQSCLTAAWKFGASVPGIPITNTIKQVSRRKVVTWTIPRDLLWEIQTPQVFRKALLIRAYREAIKEGFYGTDDSSVVERAGGIVKVVKGDPWNIKITLPSDLIAAEAFLHKLPKTH